MQVYVKCFYFGDFTVVADDSANRVFWLAMICFQISKWCYAIFSLEHETCMFFSLTNSSDADEGSGHSESVILRPRRVLR